MAWRMHLALVVCWAISARAANRTKLYIAFIDTYTKSMKGQAGIGAEKAMAGTQLFNDMIIDSNAILPDYELVLESFDDESDYEGGSRALLQALKKRNYVAVFGPAATKIISTVARLSPETNMPHVTTSLSNALNNLEKYPNVMRTLPTFASAYASQIYVMHVCGFKKAAFWYSDPSNFASVKAAAQAWKIELKTMLVPATSQSMYWGAPWQKVGTDMLRRQRTRVLMTILNDELERLGICTLIKDNMRGMVRFFPAWYTRGWWEQFPTSKIVGICAPEEIMSEVKFGIFAYPNLFTPGATLKGLGGVTVAGIPPVYDNNTVSLLTGGAIKTPLPPKAVPLTCAPKYTGAYFWESDALIAKEAAVIGQGLPPQYLGLAMAGWTQIKMAMADGLCVLALAFHKALYYYGITKAQLEARSDSTYATVNKLLKGTAGMFTQGLYTLIPGTTQVMPQFIYINQFSRPGPVSGGVRMQNPPIGIFIFPNGDAGKKPSLEVWGSKVGLYDIFLPNGSIVSWLTSASMSPFQLFPDCMAESGILVNAFCVPCPTGQYFDKDLGAGGSCRNCTLGQFQNASGRTSCEICTLGKFATGGAIDCTDCASGKFAKSSGLSECQTCDKGTHAPVRGQERCAGCPVGYYSNVSGAVSCTACAGELVSTIDKINNEWLKVKGADAPEVCRCVKTSRATGQGKCVPCTEGMICLGGGGAELLEGYAAEADGDFSVYECMGFQGRCPGGRIGTCAAGRQGAACALCAERHRPAGDGTCVLCEGVGEQTSMSLAVCLFLLCLLCMPVVLFYMFNGPVPARVTPQLLCSCSVGLLLQQMQIFAVFGLLTVPWPKTFHGVVESTSEVFTLDLDVVSAACFFDGSASGKYFFTVLIFVLVGVMPVLVMPLTRFFPLGLLPVAFRARAMLPWTLPRVLNAVGGFYQTAFITMTTVAMIPLSCFQHPNGKSTLVRHQSVFCQTPEHTSMLIPGLFLLLLCILFYAVVLYVMSIAPKMSSKSENFIFGVRFLVFKYRLDRYWWGILPLPRALLISLVPVVVPVDPRIQLLLLLVILSAYTVGTVSLSPWKAPLMNWIDVLSCYTLMGILLFAKAFLPQADAIPKENFDVIMILLVALLYAVCGVGIITGGISSLQVGTQGTLKGPLAMIAHLDTNTALNVATLSGRFWAMTQNLGTEDGKANLVSSMQGWQVADLEAVKRILDMLEKYGQIQGGVLKQSSSRSRLSFNASSDRSSDRSSDTLDPSGVVTV